MQWNKSKTGTGIDGRSVMPAELTERTIITHWVQLLLIRCAYPLAHATLNRVTDNHSDIQLTKRIRVSCSVIEPGCPAQASWIIKTNSTLTRGSSFGFDELSSLLFKGLFLATLKAGGLVGDRMSDVATSLDLSCSVRLVTAEPPCPVGMCTGGLWAPVACDMSLSKLDRCRWCAKPGRHCSVSIDNP